MIYVNAYELDGKLYSIVKNAGGDTNGAVLLSTGDGEPIGATFTVYPYDCLSSLSDEKAITALSELLNRSASDIRKNMHRKVILAEVDDENAYRDISASDVRKYTKTGMIRYVDTVDEPFSVAYDVIARKGVELYKDVTDDDSRTNDDVLDDDKYIDNVFEALGQLRKDAAQLEKSISQLKSYHFDVKRYSDELGISLPVIDLDDGRRQIIDAKASTYMQAVCHNKRYELHPDILASEINDVSNLIYGVITWQTSVKYASELDREMLVRIAKLSTLINGKNVVHMSWTDDTIENAVAIMLDGNIMIDSSYGDRSSLKTARDVIDTDDVFRFIDVSLANDFTDTISIARFVTDRFSDDEYARIAMRHTGFVRRLLSDVEYVASVIDAFPTDDDDYRAVADMAGVNVKLFDTNGEGDYLLANSLRLITYVKRFVSQDTYDNIMSTIAFAPRGLDCGVMDDVAYVPDRHTHTRYEDYDWDDMSYLDYDDDEDDDYEYTEVDDEQLDEFKERLTVLALASTSLRVKFATRHPIAVMRGFMSSPEDGARVLFENCVDGHGIRWDVIDEEMEKDGNEDKDVCDVALRLVGDGIEIYAPSYRSPYCFYQDDDVADDKAND